jgi:hypothetical protein
MTSTVPSIEPNEPSANRLPSRYVLSIVAIAIVVVAYAAYDLIVVPGYTIKRRSDPSANDAWQLLPYASQAVLLAVWGTLSGRRGPARWLVPMLFLSLVLLMPPLIVRFLGRGPLAQELHLIVSVLLLFGVVAIVGEGVRAIGGWRLDLPLRHHATVRPPSSLVSLFLLITLIAILSSGIAAIVRRVETVTTVSPFQGLAWVDAIGIGIVVGLLSLPVYVDLPYALGSTPSPFVSMLFFALLIVAGVIGVLYPPPMIWFVVTNLLIFRLLPFVTLALLGRVGLRLSFGGVDSATESRSGE